MVVVAISGGGYRAANFAYGAMAALSETTILDTTGAPKNLLNEVDYFTTVSGGGLAVASYLHARMNAPCTESDSINLSEIWRNSELDIRLNLRRNLAKNLIAALFNVNNLVSQFDRGDALQKKLNKTVIRTPADEQANCFGDARRQLKERGISDPVPDSVLLGDLFVESDSGHKPLYPYWIANATVYETGGIFPFAPDSLLASSIRCYTHVKRKPILIASDRESPMKPYYNYPLASGLRSSMNFPGAIPATTLWVDEDGVCDSESAEFLRLTDGGQSDNLAIYSALTILDHEVKHGKNRNAKHLLIVIDAFKGELDNQSSRQRSPYFYEALIRSPSLPLDAHRRRVQAGLTNRKAAQYSIIDSIVHNRDLAVAYLDLDVEQEAKQVKTTIWIGEPTQQVVYDAGYRRACRVLRPDSNGECDEYQINGDTEGSASIDSNIIAFENRSKRELMKVLSDSVVTEVEAFRRELRAYKNALSAQIESEIQDLIEQSYKNALRQTEGIGQQPESVTMRSGDFAKLTSEVRVFRRVLLSNGRRLKEEHTDEWADISKRGADELIDSLSDPQGKLLSADFSDFNRDMDKLKKHAKSLYLQGQWFSDRKREGKEAYSRLELAVADVIEKQTAIKDIRSERQASVSRGYFARLKEAKQGAQENLDKNAEYQGVRDSVLAGLKQLAETEAQLEAIQTAAKSLDRDVLTFRAATEQRTLVGSINTDTLCLKNQIVDFDRHFGSENYSGIAKEIIETANSSTMTLRQSRDEKYAALVNSVKEQSCRWPDVLSNRTIGIDDLSVLGIIAEKDCPELAEPRCGD